MKYYSFKDVVQILKKGKFILLISLTLCIGIGLFLYWATPKKYESSVLFVSVDNNSSNQRLGGIASLAGIAMIPSNGGIPMSVYQNIALSSKMLASIAKEKLVYEGDTIYLGNYFTQRMKDGFKNEYKRATTDTPQKIVKRGNLEEVYYKNFSMNANDKSIDIVELAGEMNASIRGLKEAITFSFEEGNKPIQILVKTEDPLISAVIAKTAYEKFEQYLYLITKSTQKDNTGFLRDEFQKATEEVNAKRAALAAGTDGNINANRAITNIANQRLSLEYNQAVQKYTQLNSQMELASLQEVKEKPMFLVLESPMLLSKEAASEPRFVLYVALSIILGLISGFGMIILIKFFKDNF